jgi:hypothetical protein
MSGAARTIAEEIEHLSTALEFTVERTSVVARLSEDKRAHVVECGSPWRAKIIAGLLNVLKEGKR